MPDDMIYTAKEAECPRIRKDGFRCGKLCQRHSKRTRTATDITGMIQVSYGVYRCTDCSKHFANPAVDEVIPFNHKYTRRFIMRVLAYARAHGFLATSRWLSTFQHGDRKLRVAATTIHYWHTDLQWKDVKPFTDKDEEPW